MTSRSLTLPHRPFAVVILAFCVLGSTTGSADARSAEAFSVFESTIRAYEGLTSYRDRGELVSIVRGSEGLITERFRFETRSNDADGFLFRVRAIDSGSEQVTWIEDGTTWFWESRSAAPRISAGVAPALANAFGMQAIDALQVPLLLAGDTELLPPPDAVALEGQEPCGDSECDILAVSRRGGRSLARLWIDRRDHFIRRLEVDHLPPASDGRASIEPQLSLRVAYEIEPAGAPIAAEELVFVPPATVAAKRSGLEPATSQKDDDFVVDDEITVALKTLAVRALDAKGRAIPGLTADDFEVRLGKQQVPVIAVDWVTSRGRRLETLAAPSISPPVPLGPRDETDGNLIVVFIQSDFNAVRVKGHLRVLPFMREFLESLEPDDWVAVVAFDSHLKFWHDLSRDRQSVGDAIERAIRFGARPPLSPSDGRSLARSFPAAEAKRAATPEDALRLTARSLIDIPGEKVLVYLGWGLGRYGSSGFRMTPDYRRALATLDQARTSVFVIDVTDADYHTLELGIRQVARDTGGTYVKTNDFGRREVLRLNETLAGYYLLTFDRSHLPAERRKLRVKLREGDGEVFVRERQLVR